MSLDLSGLKKQNGMIDDKHASSWLRHLRADVEEGTNLVAECQSKRGGSETAAFLRTGLKNMEELHKRCGKLITADVDADRLLEEINASSQELEGFRQDMATASRICQADKPPKIAKTTKPTE